MGSSPIFGSMQAHHLLLVGAGGFLGSVARFLIARTIDGRLNALFPFGTFVINILGSFLVGMVIGWVGLRPGYENLRLLLVTGFCGGFTTFSAFAFENYNLITARTTWIVMLYIALSITLAVLAVAGGIWTGRITGSR